MTTPGPWSPPITSTAIRIKKKSAEEPLCRAPKRLGRRFDCDDLTALVKAAGRAYPVGDIGRRALRAGAAAHLRHGQLAIIGAAHALTAVRWLAFGYSHTFTLSKFQFVQFRPDRRIQGLACAFFLPGVFFGSIGQPGAIGFAQRMLRKLQENIFPQERRQVRANHL